jgi:hypothetical protein
MRSQSWRGRLRRGAGRSIKRGADLQAERFGRARSRSARLGDQRLLFAGAGQNGVADGERATQLNAAGNTIDATDEEVGNDG